MLTNGQEEQLELKEPFERQVTLMLMRGLSCACTAAEHAASTREVESFTNAIAEGVSANLCEAEVGMSSTGDRYRALEVSVTWSRNRPIQAPAPASKITLKRT